MGGVEQGAMRVLIYDRCHLGTRRLSANASLLRDSANGTPLEITEVSRAKPFSGERDMETILLGDGAVQYDAFVITNLAKGVSEVTEALDVATSCGSLPIGRAIYLHVKDNSPVGVPPGAQTLSINRGDGYFTPHDADALVGRLKEIGRAQR